MTEGGEITANALYVLYVVRSWVLSFSLLRPVISVDILEEDNTLDSEITG